MGNWKGIVGRGFTPDAFEEYVRGLHWTNWRPSFVTLHNTAVPTLAQWHKSSGQSHMKALEAYYRDTQHWSAGPHLFVADDLIWVFTPLTVPGVHSPSWNHVALGVEMVGDYATEAFDSGPGLKVQENAIAAVAILSAALGIDSHTMKLHKQDRLTTHNCPGRNVNQTRFIEKVHDEILRRHTGEHTLAK
jgi:hypothetical protein